MTDAMVFLLTGAAVFRGGQRAAGFFGVLLYAEAFTPLLLLVTEALRKSLWLESKKTYLFLFHA
jgi:hypothetical protein